MSTESHVDGNDPDTEGAPSRPYEGRRETADVDPQPDEHEGRRQGRRGDRPGRGRRAEGPEDPARRTLTADEQRPRASGASPARTDGSGGAGRRETSPDGRSWSPGSATSSSATTGSAPRWSATWRPTRGLPEGVRVVDYGIRGMHLAYDLLDGYDALVLVDAVPGPGPPGEVTVLEVGPGDLEPGEFDAHGMDPVAVLASLPALGGELPPTYVVGCRPADVAEGIGLSAAVRGAVPGGRGAVRSLVERLVADRWPCTGGD